MKIKFYIISVIVLFLNISVLAQQFPSWYLISFTDKNNSSYTIDKPLEFLSQKAIDRRIKNNIAIDSSDFPVNQNYIDSLLNISIQPYYQSRWMNAALVKIDSAPQLQLIIDISIIDSFAFMAPFIAPKKGLKKTNRVKFHNSISESDILSRDFIETKSRTDMVMLNTLIDMGKNGKGIDIAVFDNGFNKVDKIDAFEHLFAGNQIKGVRNFTNDGKQVFRSGGHGTFVLSTMAAVVDKKFIGSAISANYYLFQTEDNRYEYPIEEANWLFAAEYADSIGADIITSSLVYSTFDDAQYDHNHFQLDGKTAIISRAANMASLKGILVFNSAGNEGTNPWGKICFPSDANSIITVGAVDTAGIIADFSSKGNSADGRIKPDIMAEGLNTPVIGYNGKISKGSGTSFSTPFVAGAAATFMSIFPEATKNEIHNAIIESSDRFLFPDSLMGYGIPNFYLASILLNMDSTITKDTDDNIRIIPNPFESNMHILFNALDSQTIKISIYDISGKLIYKKQKVQCHKGNNLIGLEEMNKVAGGIYLVNIQSLGNTYSRKVIKK